MSNGFALNYNPTLLNPSSNQALWSAMAFCRAHSVRALDAPRARVLQPRARADTLAPGFGPHGSTSPRTPLLTATRQAAPPCPTGQALAAAAARQPLAMSVPPKPLPLATCPWSSALSSTSSCRHPQPRHVALQATARRFAGELIRPPRNRPRRAIKGGPRATPCTQEALECSPSSPMAANRLGEGLLPHLRQRQPPPLPRPIRHHQGLPLSVLSTKSFLIFP